MNSSLLQLWGFDGREAPTDLLERANRGEVTGVSLFRHYNVDNASQIRDLTDSIYDAAGTRDLLIAIDQEGGQLRAVEGSTPFAGNLALGAVDDTGLTRRVAAAIGEELRAVGVTVNYAPVADVMSQPDNPSLGVRSFGSDPNKIGSHVSAFVEGLRDAAVLSVTKHFPGKGEASVDPHHGLPVLRLDSEQLASRELVPFRAAIDAGTDAIMVGHYALPLITGRDDLPASVSEIMIDGMLRSELGFEGVVITDALDMRALAQGGNAVIEALAAIRAGTDLLLSTADYERSVALDEGLGHALGRDILHAESVARSVERIAKLRQRTHRTEIPPVSTVGCDGHQQLAAELAQRSITIVRNDVGVLPISTDARLAAIMVRPLDLTPAETSSYDTPELAESLSQVFPQTKGMIVGHEPSSNEIAAAIDLARDADVVVVGTITATQAQADLVNALAEIAPVAAVALRTPFDLTTYPMISTYLCSYSVLRPSLDALSAVLAGETASGTLPVAIGDLHDRGFGLVHSS